MTCHLAPTETESGDPIPVSLEKEFDCPGSGLWLMAGQGHMFILLEPR